MNEIFKFFREKRNSTFRKYLTPKNIDGGLSMSEEKKASNSERIT